VGMPSSVRYPGGRRSRSRRVPGLDLTLTLLSTCPRRALDPPLAAVIWHGDLAIENDGSAAGGKHSPRVIPCVVCGEGA
jgi:hypothetical protein